MVSSTLGLKHHFGSSVKSTKDVIRLDTPAPASSTEVAQRWDTDLPRRLAKELIDGKVIVDVVSRPRGGPVDIYFVAEDREAAFKKSAPIIRELLRASALALDFHYLEPGELAED